MSEPHRQPTRRSGAPGLIAVALLLAFVWGYALPGLSRVRAVREGAQRLEAAGLDPAAIYYTDHPG